MLRECGRSHAREAVDAHSSIGSAGVKETVSADYARRTGMTPDDRGLGWTEVDG